MLRHLSADTEVVSDESDACALRAGMTTSALPFRLRNDMLYEGKREVLHSMIDSRSMLLTDSPPRALRAILLAASGAVSKLTLIEWV
jgi:hypothetical protein